MGDRTAPGHDIGFQAVMRIAGQFQRATGSLDQPVEVRTALVVIEIGKISLSVEWQDRLQLPAPRQRRFGGHLIGALGQW